ncbi:hypothetical protein [Kitasatospora sp. NPDC056181]|uniref:hypothetical protein n=1 Tax=Kitasatospora sp. NPDC056181 TaxID=3345737 RepID=UPI0035DAC75D
MLKPERRIVIRALLFAGLLAAPAAPATAEEPPIGGEVTHCAVNVICEGTKTPGSTPTPGGGNGGTGGGGSGGPQLCRWNGEDWPCHDPELGWFSSGTGCYYRTVSPQPAADDPAWAGHKPTEGTVYAETCRFTDGSMGTTVPKFFAQAPAQPPFDPAAEADKIMREQIALPFPEPTTAPKGTAVVGVPVWLWLANAKAPAPKSVGNGTVTVTVTPRLDSVVWDLGDGTTETCTKEGAAGTPYDPKYGAAKSPTCGHLFTTGSATKAGGTFAGTVTANWVGEVVVTGSNVNVAPIKVPLSADLTVRVAEVQVLN